MLREKRDGTIPPPPMFGSSYCDAVWRAASQIKPAFLCAEVVWGDATQPRTVQLIPLLVCWQQNLLSEFQNVLLCAELKGLNMIFFKMSSGSFTLPSIYDSIVLSWKLMFLEVRTVRQHITRDIILLALVEVEAGAELPAFHRNEQSSVRIFIFIILSVCRKVLKRGFKFNVFLNLVPDSYRY